MNVGVIGCGSIAEIAHLPAYQNAPGVRIVSLADSDPTRLNLLSRKFQVKNSFTDYHDLLRDQSIDAVSVCVPTGFHHDVVLDAASSGKDILCEKPIARTADEAKEMLAAHRKYGVELYVGFPSRFSRVTREVLNLLNRGFIKIPLDVHVGLAAPPPPRGSWYLKREMGGGCLFDMGAHAVDLLCHSFGEGRVSSAFFECPSGADADIAATVSLEIGPDVKASVEADWRSQRFEKSLKIRGENGFIAADSITSVVNVSQPRVTLGKRVGQFTLRFEQRISEYWNEVWEFVESVRRNKTSSALANGEDGLTALRVVEEAYRHFERKGDAHG